LKTQVEFWSNKFPPYQNEEDQINPGLWGKRLAEFLRDKLPRYGLKVIDIGAEVWGWMVEIENKAFSLWVGCGHQSGGDDEFLCFIEPTKPVIRRWFKKIDTTVQVTRVVEALSRIFSSDPDIRDVHWRSDKEN